MSKIDGYKIKGRRGSWFATVSRDGESVTDVPVVWVDGHDVATGTYRFCAGPDASRAEINRVQKINAVGRQRRETLVVVARAKDPDAPTRDRQEYRRVLRAVWEPSDDPDKEYRFRVVAKG